MKVRDIMEASPTRVSPDTKVAELATTILESGLPGLPVLAGNGKILGVVTQRDLVAKHANVHLPRYLGILGYVVPLQAPHAEEDLQRVLAVTARDLMETKFHSVRPDLDVDDAATLMVDEDVDLLLVTKDEELVGVLTDADVIRLLIVEERDADQAAD